MATQITSFLYSFLLALFLIFSNAYQVLCDPNSILDHATIVTTLDHLSLPSNANGAESTAFDKSGTGPYTGVVDGRILKYAGPSTGFVEFAVSSEYWSKQLCESNDVGLESVCGKPEGLGIFIKTGTLYIADAYYNLRTVGPNGGVATLVASSAEGVPFKYPNGLDIDQETGIVYFTDASARFQSKDTQVSVNTREMSGRLMTYDPTTKQVTVLLRDLAFPNGAAISKDGSFVLISEFDACQVQRYWVNGPKANTSDIFFSTPGGTPDNIKRNADGDFWVAVSFGNRQEAIPVGVLLGQDGQVLRALNFAKAINQTVPISNVEEHNGKLYVSNSMNLNYIGVTRSVTG